MGSTSSFELATRENANSRKFGGVHLEISNLDEVATGLELADFLLNESDLFG